MSLSKSGRVLTRAYKSLSRSRRSSRDESGGGGGSSFLPQVTEKVEALERQCGGIEIDSPSSQHRPVIAAGQETEQSDLEESDPVDEHLPVSISPTTPRQQSESTTCNSRSIDISASGRRRSSCAGPVAPETGEQLVAHGAGALAAGAGSLQLSRSQDSWNAASTRMTPKEVAQHLISKEDMSDYFSTLVDQPATMAIEENLSEEKCEFTSTYEESRAQERGEERFTKLYDLPLKLILTPLCIGGRVISKFASLLEMQFGPLHAALQVGDVILEWNDSSLVVPHFAEHDDQLMKTDVRHLTDWVSFTSGEVPSVREAIQSLDYRKQIELIYKVTAEKQRLIDNLVDVIVTYNRQFYYDVIRRNCQHFVTDALKALGVTEPIEFTGGLGEYFRALKQGRSKALHATFTSHVHLDNYIREKEQSGEVVQLTKHDLEYLLAQYFRYHLEQKTRLQRDNKEVDLNDWGCEVKGCCMERLEKRIDFESLRIHSFKTYDKPH